ncbi:hypothetical protein [Mycobacterium marinum]|uniref:hypothetical protein n=1 Tax=Mycobacterium marinum TaxID=1781 RepID=UPI0018C9A2FF
MASKHSRSVVPVAFVIVPCRIRCHRATSVPLAIYTHLFPSDHTEHMTALAAMNVPVQDNVVAMRRHSS